MKKQPLVSICIPTYNNEKTIIETIKSIMAQTYDNIQIIVGDNCSTDKTLYYVTMTDWPKAITIFKNIKNIGPAANNNKLIETASGDFICIFHADDVYHKDIIKEQIKIMNMFSKCGAVFALRQVIDENGKIIKKISLPFKVLIDFIYGTKETFFPRMLKHGNFFVCPTAMVRKEVYDKVGLYKVSKYFNSTNYTDESQMVIDQDMWLRIMDKYRMVIVDKYLINYRIHLEQGSMVINRRRKTISPEYELYDKYIDKWKYRDALIIKKFNEMRSRGYLFCAINCLLEKDERINYNVALSYFNCYNLPFPFGNIRWALNTFPHFLMRIIILSIVKILKLMRLNRKYLFLNYM